MLKDEFQRPHAGGTLGILAIQYDNQVTVSGLKYIVMKPIV